MNNITGRVKLETGIHASPSLCYLKVHQLGDVGVCDEHLMDEAADETLDFSQVTQQASLWLHRFHIGAPLLHPPRFGFPRPGGPAAPQRAVCVGPQQLLFGGWQANLQEDLDCCTVLQLEHQTLFHLERRTTRDSAAKIK